MTREEAITVIDAARKTMYLPKSKQYISDLGYALEMAIEALKSQEKRITREDIYIALKASPCMYYQNGVWYEETELLQSLDDMYFNEGDEE